MTVSREGRGRVERGKARGKGTGAHDSLERAGNRLARYLEDRYDYMKRLGPDGYRASYGLLRALVAWRQAVTRHRASARAERGSP